MARETGLALSTVSNALAGKQHVSEETRALVQQATERLGYRASAVARALRMQRSFTIGVLVADVANPSSPDFVRGVEDVAVREKCTLLLCNTDGDEEKQLWHMRTLLDRQVDGMVMISQHVASPAVRALLASGTPYVLVQRRNPEVPEDYVGSDNVTGLSEAIHHLHALGHRRIGFVRGPADSSSARERLETFLAEAAGLRLKVDDDLVYRGDYGFESGISAGRHFLRLRRPPTAVLGSSDINALGLIEAALESGLAVPGQLSVVGLDDIALAGFRAINLTTVHLQKRAMGAAAADLLIERIREPGLPPREQIFPTRLVVRGTTAPPTKPETAKRETTKRETTKREAARARS
ncbi:LacI family DNA-binding transcriptional regulator [Azospirillum sp. ST 5-10]|uniref:LacI family DNA-binding transcriptional regulator n=1 Tax=Azospirillum sp. ST 5-10 TaxID=3445776 RepID=UPI003F4A195B